jgi:hypothetical protein
MLLRFWDGQPFNGKVEPLVPRSTQRGGVAAPGTLPSLSDFSFGLRCQLSIRKRCGASQRYVVFIIPPRS